MTLIRRIKSMFSPVETKFVPASKIDVDRVIAEGTESHYERWRVDANGEQWFKVSIPKTIRGIPSEGER